VDSAGCACPGQLWRLTGKDKFLFFDYGPVEIRPEVVVRKGGENSSQEMWPWCLSQRTGSFG